MLLQLQPYLRPFLWRFVSIFILILLGAALTVIQPLVLKNLVDLIASKNNLYSMALAAGVLLVLPVLSSFLGVMYRRMASIVSADFLYSLRVDVYAHLQKLPYSLYVHAPPGELNARMSGDIALTTQMIERTFPDGVYGILRLFGSLLAMFVLDWRLTLASLVVMPLIGLFARARNQRLHKILQESMSVESALGLHIGETLRPLSIMNIRLFDRTQTENHRFIQLAAELRNIEKQRDFLHSENIVVSSLITALGSALVYAFGGMLVSMNIFTIGTVIAFVAYLGSLYATVQGLANLPQSMSASLLGLQRVFELLNLPTEQDVPVHPVTTLPERVAGHLVFDDVSFCFVDEVPFSTTARPWSLALMRYSASQSEATTLNALTNISFSVQPGQMVALVGPSGAGKSTLFNLIPRFYNPDSGSVMLDGYKIRDVPITWLRQQVGFVSQNIYLFPGTLGDNLRYANPEATQDEIDQACKQSNLAEFIASLPHGYETYVGAGGARLSGGEIQRLALARALLKRAPIMLLDEPTSHLDSLNESILRDALARVRSIHSTLVIAHRLTTVQAADLILVLDRGRIVERGKHEELLKIDGLYALLYQKQFAPQYTNRVI
jgi:ATP-binding cassette subfamily B protein